MKYAFYGAIVALYLGGAVSDFCRGEVRIAVVAVLYAAATAALFLWR